jgi:YHS domain-containing protein
MKKILLVSLLFTACSQHSNNEDAVAKAKAKIEAAKPANKFPGVEFASKKDLSCGMPLAAGLEDTAHYNGKIYGFCSNECKDSFLTDPEKYLAKK